MFVPIGFIRTSGNSPAVRLCSLLKVANKSGALHYIQELAKVLYRTPLLPRFLENVGCFPVGFALA